MSEQQTWVESERGEGKTGSGGGHRSDRLRIEVEFHLGGVKELISSLRKMSPYFRVTSVVPWEEER
jgi:hypothetical protein